MIYSEIFDTLNRKYLRLDPHHETWDLWIKSGKTQEEMFEVAIGTVLVQNTNWRNVNKAIKNLKKATIRSFDILSNLELDILEQLIRPAGFYVQKAIYLQALCNLLLSYSDLVSPPARNTLLDCPGIGKETADSILVYCYQQPIPVVGTYTRRFLARFHMNIEYLSRKYELIQDEIQQGLPQDSQVFGRFHALLVVHNQNTCQKHDPKCDLCTLQVGCRHGQLSEGEPGRVQIQEAISGGKSKSKLKQST